MAAGVGSRLNGITSDIPKCLIKAGNETLISRIVKICHNRNLFDITVITGYKSNLIKQELGDQVTFLENPFYSITNSISSLWLARYKLEGDVILMNADLYFEESLFDVVLNQSEPVVMLADSTRIETADYRFAFEEDRIIRYGKHLSNKDTDGEYVGIARIDRSFIECFRERLEQMLSSSKFHDWWEEVLYSFVHEGIPINYSDIAGTFWTEVDTAQDYQRLQKWVGKQNKSTPSLPVNLTKNFSPPN